MTKDASSGRGDPDPVIVRPAVAHIINKALNRLYTRPRSKIHMTRYPAHNPAFVPDQRRSGLNSFEVSVPTIMPPMDFIRPGEDNVFMDVSYPLSVPTILAAPGLLSNEYTLFLAHTNLAQ
jgi:hypothetical protein